MKQQSKVLPAISIVITAALLPACSAFYSDSRPEVLYQKADSAEQLVIPPDLSSPRQSAGFVISGVDNEKITPNTLLPELDEIRYVRDGDVSWLALSSAPEDLWGGVREFLQREGYLLRKESPLEGIMQTTWAEETLAVPRAGLLGVIDKTLELIRPNESLTTFTFRFERAEQGGTHLFVDYRTIAEQRIDDDARDEDGTFAYRDAERNPEIESRMLMRLLVYLGIDVQRAKGILSEEDIARMEADAYIAQGDDFGTALVVTKTYALVWDEVEIALEDLLFDIEYGEFDVGRFDVSYTGDRFVADEPEEEDGGILQSLGAIFSAENTDVRTYQVYLGDRPDGTYITLSDDNGEQLNNAEELSILNAIKLQITSS
ncbi:MAG: outer membrane protein assembly factor BamC [Pseudomonadota bacterium]